MKRWLSILLAALMSLSLVACGTDYSVGIIGGADSPTQIYVSEDGDDYDETLSEEDASADEDNFEADTFDQSHDPNADTYITDTGEEEEVLPEDGVYTSKEDVAYFIYLYGRLPDNFITKNEARDLGWEGGSLEAYAPGMCIGGDYFGNREGLLPEADGRSYTECDIDTLGAEKRGAKRIVFSNDGLIFYTEDHYEFFELLYGDIEYDTSDD